MKASGYIVSIAVISAAVLGCESSKPADHAAIETAQARVVESRQEQAPVTVKATGTLRARQTAMLSAQVMGRVEQVLVREGDSVRAGQTLVVLDSATLKSTADQAEAAVKAAENQQIAAQTQADLAASTLARYKQLQSEKSVSPQEMDEVTRRAEAASAQVDALRAQVNAMKAQQSGARSMLGYARVTAPFAGVVTSRMVDPGALASPGVPLVQIDSAGPLQLQASVAESAIGSVRKGMKIAVSVDSVPDAALSGTVSEIVPAADAASRSFLVKIDIPPSPNLRAGMYAAAEIPTGTKQAILAPRAAIVMRGSLPCAYVLDSNGVAQLRYVTLGAAHGDAVEILSGIAANERLVDSPADRDLAGKRIEAQP
ncbi:MAG: efflux RND transporter periplasmic adaptor subunit [Acidobacteriaceae bacterium]|nr:efflux RND transporter periplasmic adaptor subunit [Acidobacteriaceae bacterium]